MSLGVARPPSLLVATFEQDMVFVVAVMGLGALILLVAPRRRSATGTDKPGPIWPVAVLLLILLVFPLVLVLRGCQYAFFGSLRV